MKTKKIYIGLMLILVVVFLSNNVYGIKYETINAGRINIRARKFRKS